MSGRRSRISAGIGGALLRICGVVALAVVVALATVVLGASASVAGRVPAAHAATTAVRTSTTAAVAAVGRKAPPTPTPAPTPAAATPAPTGSLSQREQALRYLTAVQPKVEAETKAFEDFVTTCDPSDLATCRSGLQKIHDANADLEETLKTNEAPTCLREVDTETHAATKLIDEAMHNGTAGIDQSDPALIAKSAEQIDQATTHLDRATELMDHNAC